MRRACGRRCVKVHSIREGILKDKLRRDAFTRADAKSISDLSHMRDGQKVKIGGLIVARQSPPTAKGFHFLAVEDSHGMLNVIVAPKVYDEYRLAMRATFVVIEGVLQKQ